ncbi:MAG: zinc-ribbon domain-containing protein [Caulobacter sp.]|jgi:predicted Zn finger-like uncharacterized protein|nr:zinc-ribbon domain-containing protein [Caulobacter sp.]
MILTCPECATRYFVPDEKVSASGRTVRCSSCGNRWTAYGQDDLELFVDPEAGAAARDPKVEDLPVSELPGEELPKVFRQKATNERRVREAATAGVIWAGMAVAVVAIGAGAFVFRGSVVDIWPKTASAYAAVGLDVNRVGLEIEDVRAEAALQDGHAALAVSGVMRNVGDKPVQAPPLRLSLLNRNGKVVMVKLAAPADPVIPPGETRHFALAMLDPPTTSVALEVTFDLTKGAKGEKAAATKAPEPKKVELRGLADPEPLPPVEAEAVAEGHGAAPDNHAPETQDAH